VNADGLAAALRESADETLLNAYAPLTHRLHAACPGDAAGLREQRDHVEAEILHRMRS
jgi:hypothetical protein